MNEITFEDKKVIGKDCPEFRVSYEQIHKAKAFQGQEPKYGLTMLFPKGTKLDVLKKAAVNAGKSEFGDKFKVGPKGEWPKGFKSPFRNGDEESDQPGYENMIFVRASGKKRPRLVDQKLEPIAHDEIGQEQFYSGCYARASLVARGYDFNGNKGVAFTLLTVQKTKDGERFGGHRPVEEEFDAVETVGADDATNYEASDDSDGMFS